MIVFTDRSAVRVILGCLAIAAFVAFIAWAIQGCLPASNAAAYAGELQLCEVGAKTCQDYVACRARVAREYGREYKGRCKP
jgi:hypothetical protein